MDELLRWVKSGERIEGVDEIVYPGERGQRRAAEITASGKRAAERGGLEHPPGDLRRERRGAPRLTTFVALVHVRKNTSLTSKSCSVWLQKLDAFR